MVKLLNTSGMQIVLKFQNAAGLYTKPLRGGAELKLNDREYKELLPLDPAYSSLVKITKYNVYGSLNKTYEIHNPSKDRITVRFEKSEKDFYSKSIQPNGVLSLNEDQFALVKTKLDPRLKVASEGLSKKAFVAVAENIVKPSPTEIIPTLENPVMIEETKEDKSQTKIYSYGKNKNKNKNSKLEEKEDLDEDVSETLQS